MEMPNTVAGVVRRVQSQVAFLSSADQVALEILEILRSTRRILGETQRTLGKMEKTMDRLSAAATQAEERVEAFGMSPERLARLEEAVFNIERATSGVEVALAAMPKSVRNRMAKAADEAAEFVEGVTDLPDRPRRTVQ
jgi:hypothetical protein